MSEDDDLLARQEHAISVYLAAHGARKAIEAALDERPARQACYRQTLADELTALQSVRQISAARAEWALQALDAEIAELAKRARAAHATDPASADPLDPTPDTGPDDEFDSVLH